MSVDAKIVINPVCARAYTRSDDARAHMVYMDIMCVCVWYMVQQQQHNATHQAQTNMA